MYEIVRFSFCPICGVPAVCMQDKEPRVFKTNCPVGNQEGSVGIYFMGESCTCRFMIVVGRHKGDLLVNVVEVSETYKDVETVHENNARPVWGI